LVETSSITVMIVECHACALTVQSNPPKHSLFDEIRLEHRLLRSIFYAVGYITCVLNFTLASFLCKEQKSYGRQI